MCGIAGFVDKKDQLSSTAKERLIKEMTGVIEHRGRDDDGFLIEGKVGLGHVRLSIIDLSKQGHQPFLDEERENFLSYNGEVYNYKELNSVLGSKYKFRTSCDTETLLNSYKAWGSDCLKNLRGMFAFSIFDKLNNLIFLGGDRFSIKPLYYINNEDWFAWSSEIKSLLLLPGFIPVLAENKLPEYFLFRSVAGEDTLIGSIKRLLPAQKIFYFIDKQEIKKEYYWSSPPLDTKRDVSDSELEVDLLKKINDSVDDHLVSDVPVGFQLSGGVDSSLITFLAKKKCDPSKEVHSFSIGLADEGWNEFAYSRQAAQLCNTIHHEIVFTEDEFCDNLPAAIYHYDEPVNHPHTVPIYLLSKFARNYVKVLLSGEGCDEVFGGYRRYLSLQEGKNLSDRDLILSSSFGKQADIDSILNFDSGDDFSYREKILHNVLNENLSRKISWLDLKTYLPPLLLRQDKMGMAANLEGRIPFLDHRLVEFGFSLPPELKFFNGETKILVKKVASKFLPHELVYRPKCGFGLPIKEWLKHKDGLGRFLSMFTAPITPRSFFNYASITRLINEHVSGAVDHTEILWTLINLEIWLRIFFDKTSPGNMLFSLDRG